VKIRNEVPAANPDDPVTDCEPELPIIGLVESHKRMTYGFKKFFPAIHMLSEYVYNLYTYSPDLYTATAPSLLNREVCNIL